MCTTGCSMHADGMQCPDNDFMCRDPGLLTCLGDLNDCSGKGDCLKGNCYCHSGWGGADCSVPACLRNVGCEDVRFLCLCCTLSATSCFALSFQSFVVHQTVGFYPFMHSACGYFRSTPARLFCKYGFLGRCCKWYMYLGWVDS